MLYLFKNIKHKEILDSIKASKYDDALSLLANFALSNHLSGNIWKKYILYTLMYNDNPYTRMVERVDNQDLTDSLVDSDLSFFYEEYNSKYTELAPILDFKISSNKSFKSSLVDELYEAVEKNNSFTSFKKAILNFYAYHGIGDMAFYKAFRVDDGNLIPIHNVLDVTFDDLIGYDEQKKLLMENTEYFLTGNQYNNVLLYGDSGTGKSTSIKALLNTYFSRGLRIIEVYKHQMAEIAKIINTLKNRPYYYVIYMDDLSFEDNEVEYKYLKSIIEGGIEPKPNNAVIYATSNRRHLIKETFRDNMTDDLHRNETVAEKLSLASRFGLQIYYSSLSPDKFREMVIKLAKKNDIKLDEKTLLLEANKWELTYGSLSGRCATQFIKHISNKY